MSSVIVADRLVMYRYCSSKVVPLAAAMVAGRPPRLKATFAGDTIARW